MLITVKCPLCETPVDAESTSFGTSQPCPKCDEGVEIPEAYIGEGVTLAGFDLKNKVGKGGMGVVYLANQISMQRSVAVKVLPPSMTSNRESVERFLKEARMSARLEHPNIVTIIDAGEDNGFYYLAMRYVEGETLEERLKRHRPLPEKIALRYMGQVVTALDFAWRHHKILHRDIKPSNIMIDEYDEVKLLDMGLAKDLLEDSSLTVAGTILGTPYYMSPEQAKSSNELDFHSDMYSVGATLFHLLTGRTPFDGEGAISIMTKHITEPAPDVRTLNHGISEPTAHLVARLLEKEKDDRFESYQEVLDIVNGLLDDEDVIVPLTNPNIQMEPLGAFPAKKRVSVQPRTLFLATALAVSCLITGVIIVKILQSGSTRGGPVVAGPVDEPDQIVPSPGKSEEELRKERAEKERALAKKQQQLRDRVRKELSAIQKAASGGDVQLKAALRDCRQLKTLYASSIMVAEIDQVLDTLETRYSNYRTTVLQEIKKRVEAFRRSGKLNRAISYLDDYKGPLPKETQRYRHSLLGGLKDELKKKREEEQFTREREEILREVAAEKERKIFASTLNDVAEKVAALIIKQDYTAARTEYNALINDGDYQPYRGEIKNTFLGLDVICDINQTILDTFDKEVGQTVTIKLKKKKSKALKITGVDAETVRAVWEYEEGKTRGTMASDFTLADLTPSERYSRLKRAELTVDTLAVMKALIHLEVDEKEKAVPILSKSNLPIAQVLLSRLGETPQQAMRRLLTLAGLPDDEIDFGLLQNKFSQREYSAGELKRIRLEASRFLARFNNHIDAEEYLPLVRKMAGDAVSYHFPKGLVAAKSTPVKADLYGAGATESIRLQTRFALANNLAIEAENTMGMRFRLVPEGASHNHLGNPPISAYYLGKYEVTAKQFKDVMGHSPFYRGDNLPAENIMITQAVQFLDKLCEREGVATGSYRLPSSVEWVYACSAGVTSTYYFGDDVGKLNDFANYLDRTAPEVYDAWGLDGKKDKQHSDGNSMTAAIASYPANPWGFYDILGNVAEYVADGDLKFAQLRGTFKGGAWIFPQQFCHPAHVESLQENMARIATAKKPMPFGFRVLRVIPKD